MAKKNAISEKIIKELSKKFINEAQTARTYKQKRVTSWQKNEDMYYMKKVITDDTRSNVDAGKMQGYIHTFLSKIDSNLDFHFKYRKEADLKSVAKVNALKDQDSNDNDWDIKDLAGKKQVSLYGRAIFAYYAESIKGEYKANLNNIDVYDFLIDPRVGGIDIEQARYLGYFGTTLDSIDLEEGAKNNIYIKSAVKKLLKDGGNSTSPTGVQEDVNKKNRETIEGGTSKEDMTYSKDDDVYYFWQWFTTYKGERYYLLITDNGDVVRAEHLEDIFKATKKCPRGFWPIWSYAAYPDLTEFWTPSPADVVRDIFEAQGLSINQMIDLAELIVDPMKLINPKNVKNKAQLKTKPGAVIEVTPGAQESIDSVLQFVRFADITTPRVVYDTLNAIGESESGITGGMRGLSEEDKVAIYEGNQAQAADRLSLVNKSFSKGYKRFAYLWLWNAQMHLKKKTAIDMIGPDGIQISDVSRKDFRGYADFVPVVESTDAEINKDLNQKRQQFQFLASLKNNPEYNQRKVTELQAKIVDIDKEDIRELLDVGEYGSAELMSEAARDIEELLEGRMPKPNQAANMAYMQKIIDWTKDNEEYMNNIETIMMFDQYIQSIDPIVTRNAARSLNSKMAEMKISAGLNQMGGGTQENVEKTTDTMNEPSPIEEPAAPESIV